MEIVFAFVYTRVNLIWKVLVLIWLYLIWQNILSIPLSLSWEVRKHFPYMEHFQHSICCLMSGENTIARRISAQAHNLTIFVFNYNQAFECLVEKWLWWKIISWIVILSRGQCTECKNGLNGSIEDHDCVDVSKKSFSRYNLLTLFKEASYIA